MIFCKQCSKLITTHPNIFCNSSCAASYNNIRKKPRHPKRTTYSKFAPLSRIASGPYTQVFSHCCTNCKKPFWSTKSSNSCCSDTCFLTIKRKNAAGSKSKKLTYKNIVFDSQWEIDVAIKLDEMNIEWIVPSYSIPWIDKSGKSHKYFPDFYLPKYDVYLDPKNKYVIKDQEEKLSIVIHQIKLFYGEPSHIINEVERMTRVERA